MEYRAEILGHAFVVYAEPRTYLHIDTVTIVEQGKDGQVVVEVEGNIGAPIVIDNKVCYEPPVAIGVDHLSEPR